MTARPSSFDDSPRSSSARIAHLFLTVFAVATLALAAGCGNGSPLGDDHPLDSVADRLITAALSLNVADGQAGTPTAVPGAREVGRAFTIGNSGGTGISLRSDCLDSARSGGGWADAVAVVTVEVGADRCAGWTRVSSAGVNSWVRNEYLVAAGAAQPPSSGSAAPAAAGDELRRGVESLREIVWRTGSLLRSTPGRGDGLLAPAYLRSAASDARALETRLGTAPPASPASCAAARETLRRAARDLQAIATEAGGFFASPAPDGVRPVERAAATYVGTQTALAAALNACPPS